MMAESEEKNHIPVNKIPNINQNIKLGSAQLPAKASHEEEPKEKAEDPAKEVEDVHRKEEKKPLKKEPKKELRGKKAARHLMPGIYLHNRIRIEKFLGGGGFGQVYKAIDTQHDNRVVAVKVEPWDKESGRMILEQNVLTLLRGTKHCPFIIASGTIDAYLYIVMEYLGRNINDLRRMQAKHRFSPATATRVTIQMISALRAVHHIGFLHRDVKPSNMCVGVGDLQTRRNVFLVDFGMTRRFIGENGERRRERQYAGFRGTMRYVSVTVHERREQGPCDDLWSLMYAMIEVGEGALPWRNIEDDEAMAIRKKKVTVAMMIRHLPKEFKSMAEHLATLTYDSTPDYDHLMNLCRKGLKPGVTDDTPYDWESQTANSDSVGLESE